MPIAVPCWDCSTRVDTIVRNCMLATWFFPLKQRSNRLPDRFRLRTCVSSPIMSAGQSMRNCGNRNA